jgi:hypothetical protein
MAGIAFVIVAKVIIIKDRRQRGILVCRLSYKVAEHLPAMFKSHWNHNVCY